MHVVDTTNRRERCFRRIQHQLLAPVTERITQGRSRQLLNLNAKTGDDAAVLRKKRPLERLPCPMGSLPREHNKCVARYQRIACGSCAFSPGRSRSAWSVPGVQPFLERMENRLLKEGKARSGTDRNNDCQTDQDEASHFPGIFSSVPKDFFHASILNISLFFTLLLT